MDAQSEPEFEPAIEADRKYLSSLFSAELVRRLSGYIVRCGVPVQDVDLVVTDVKIKICRKLSGTPGYRHDESEFTFLAHVARYAVRDYRRDRDRPVDRLANGSSTGHRPADKSEQRPLQMAMREDEYQTLLNEYQVLLKQLLTSDQDLIRMHYFEGLPLDEVAVRMGKSIGSV